MDHMHHASGASRVAAVALIALLALQVVGVGGLVAYRRSGARIVLWGLFAAAIGAVAFQVLHFVEHLAQLGYWIGHPTQAPWMTPWAMSAAHGLADLGGPSPMAVGMELLHLVGNSIFFVGAVTLAVLVGRCAAGSPAARTTRALLWVQGLHVVEHVALTSTLLWTGKAAGLSTFFGLADPGPVLWSYRVWWHFLINLAATALLLRAVWQFWPHWAANRGLTGAAVSQERAAPAHRAPAAPAVAYVASLARQLDLSRIIETTVRIVRLATVVAATILLADVLLVVLSANPDNAMVTLVRGLADTLVLSFRDLFVPDDLKIRIVINYGLAAAAYFIVGRVVTSLRRTE